MTKLKFGIIGCGGIANSKHFPALAKLSDKLEIVAFCDVIEERAAKAAAEYGVEGALVTTDYRDIANHPDIDVIHVLTPNVSHSEITVASLEGGKHVMCEKPMAINYEEAKAMLEWSEEMQNQLRVVQPLLNALIQQIIILLFYSPSKKLYGLVVDLIIVNKCGPSTYTNIFLS